MPKSKSAAAKKSAEIQIKGQNIVLSGALASEVQYWIERREPETLRDVLGALAGMPPKNLVKIEIELPENLFQWLKEEADNLDSTVSEFVQQTLEVERYSTARMFFMSKKKGGAR